jgi:ABC-type glycerol-3-phosphate transport system substrate-binding protein
MNMESFKTFDGYAGEIKRYLEKYASTKAIYGQGLGLGWNMFFPWSGLRIIDYENKKVNVDGDDFKKVMEAYKDIFIQDSTGLFSPFYPAEALKNGEILLNKSYSIFTFAMRYGEIAFESSPVYFPFPAVNGKTTAEVKTSASILATSPNKANAYEFLKILLSEEIQYEDVNSFFREWYIMPVVNTVFDKMVPEAVEYINKWDRGAAPVLTNVVWDYLNICTSIDDCQFNVYGVIQEIFYTYMLPYFKNEDTYENCLNKTRNFLELYVSE